MLPSTLQFFIVMIACSINERMQKALDYKAEEVVILKQILREVTNKRRVDFTEDHPRLVPQNLRGQVRQLEVPATDRPPTQA